MPAGHNMLSVADRRGGFNVVNAVSVINMSVGLVNSVSGAGGADFVVLRSRIVRRNGAICGADRGCDIWNEALKGGCTLRVGGLRVSLVSDVTRVLQNHRSARETGRYLRRTW